MNIHHILNKIYPMPDASIDKFEQLISQKVYPKGFCILKEGKIEPDVYFIDKGIARAYINVDGKEITFWIGKEGATVVSLKSYVSNQQ